MAMHIKAILGGMVGALIVVAILTRVSVPIIDPGNKLGPVHA